MATEASGIPRLKVLLVGVLALTTVPALAKGPETSTLNAATLVQMETQADHAKPREQCYLYTQLVDALTDSASRQVAAGDDEDAGKTVGWIAEVTAKLQLAAERNAKKLKDAEKILNESARRLTDMSRISTGDQRDELRRTVQKLDAAHTKVLAMVFLQ
jgi:hypothetical protein